MTDTPMNELAFLDATAQAELVRNQEIKPGDLVDAAIDRVERLNPQLNAVITPMYDLARAAAKGEIPSGPFRGVPFLLKDFIAEYAGVRFTEGSAFLKDYVPDEDSEFVRRLKRAGCIVIGKTNLPEFAIGASTEPRLFGPTRNPWNPERTAGGSSGGSAAAITSGMVAIAHGNDAGGSIRIPASCCGLFGLKPTRGRNPLGPHYGDLFSGVVAEHVLTRSVRDSAAFLDAVSGPDPGDPYGPPPPARPFLAEAGSDPGRLRIAYAAQTPLGTELHSDCVAAVEDAAKLCEELGHEVTEAKPSYDAEGFWQAMTSIFAVGTAWGLEDWSRRTGRSLSSESFEPFVWAFSARGRDISAPEYMLAVQDVQRESRNIARFFEDYDLWLTPTLGQPPVPLGMFSIRDGAKPEEALEVRKKTAAFSPFTYISNGTGQPSMSVPLFWNGENLPVGVHFAARFGEEAMLFRLAAQLEAARPWKDRRPPIAV